MVVHEVAKTSRVTAPKAKTKATDDRRYGEDDEAVLDGGGTTVAGRQPASSAMCAFESSSQVAGCGAQHACCAPPGSAVDQLLVQVAETLCQRRT